jgi:hypothetical protein
VEQGKSLQRRRFENGKGFFLGHETESTITRNREKQGGQKQKDRPHMPARGWPHSPDFTIGVPETITIIGFLALK